MAKVKTCCKCKGTFHTSCFTVDNTRKDGLRARCRACDNETNRESKYKRLFGITLAEYDRMLEEQGGVCDICKKPPMAYRLSVDHDHKTGAVRGLLCPPCNRSLEKYIYLKDNINEYIRKNYGENNPL